MFYAILKTRKTHKNIELLALARQKCVAFVLELTFVFSRKTQNGPIMRIPQLWAFVTPNTMFSH